MSITTRNIKKRTVFDDENCVYVITLKKRRFPWWILLLLLPLLLLIKCNKTITAKCFESENRMPITGQSIHLQYIPHYIYNNGVFFPSDTLKISRTTDTSGVAVFDSLQCSVFSYIFYCLSKADFSALSRCHQATGVKTNFHYTSHVDLPMEPRRENLYVKVLDSETGDDVPDCMMRYTYIENGQRYTDSARCNAESVAEFPNMRFCSTIDLEAHCYGYADTAKRNVQCENLLTADVSNAIRLRPLKERVSFFVKNKETGEQIPDALATVTLTHPKGRTESHDIHTSTDGKGIAFYDDAFILASIDIKAQKKHFKEGGLDGNITFTVDKIIQEPDTVRTIWLIPEPFVVQFINTDSINGRPVSGVANHITIIDPNGTTTETDETSNSNGVFPILAKENSKIIIQAKKRPLYKDKKRTIAQFSETVHKKVLMPPDMATLEFRTTDGTNVLPNCNLKITGSTSGNLNPINYANGVFNVKFRKDERLSITASKSGYSTNSTKVNNAGLNQLGKQNARDIPLTKRNWNYNRHQTSVTPGYTENQCYDLYESPITFTFILHEFCNANCTTIKVMDANGNTLAEFSSSDNPPITRRLTSPTRKICVSVVDKNGHAFNYSIKQ